MKTSYEQLLSVIPNHPALRIMHFVEHDSPLIDALAHLTGSREYEYLLLSFTDTVTEVLTLRYASSPHIKVKQITHTQARFHVQAKMYDYVFVEASVPDEDIFLKKVYMSMKNSAMLFILSSEEVQKTEPWRIGMEENFYVAFNTFSLTDAIQVISAKKMHGWGG